jgi:hypothetical protein
MRFDEDLQRLLMNRCVDVLRGQDLRQDPTIISIYVVKKEKSPSIGWPAYGKDVEMSVWSVASPSRFGNHGGGPGGSVRYTTQESGGMGESKQLGLGCVCGSETRQKFKMGSPCTIAD